MEKPLRRWIEYEDHQLSRLDVMICCLGSGNLFYGSWHRFLFWFRSELLSWSQKSPFLQPLPLPLSGIGYRRSLGLGQYSGSIAVHLGLQESSVGLALGGLPIQGTFRPQMFSNRRLTPGPTNVAATSRTKRRIVVTLILLFIVATVVPFQFAYVVACVVQFSSCVKALNRAREVHFRSNFSDCSSAMTVDKTNLFGHGLSSTIHIHFSF
jgi:hypothetical protein